MIMIPQEEITRLISQATKDIENFRKTHRGFDSHMDLAELFFARADIYLASKEYHLALMDYETCLDYDAYFFEAVNRMEMLQKVQFIKAA